MPIIKIANRIIGENEPCFIIAEAGINHNGSIELAKKLIDAAVEAKADAIKFQTFIAEEEVTKMTPKAKYQSKNTDKNESYYDMIKKLEFDEEQHKILMDYCKQKDIIFLSTPSEEKSAEMLNRLGVEAFKIGSNDIVTLPMLEKIAEYKKPVIMSRGMATEDEIEEAIHTIKGKGNNDIIILHCISNYPSNLKDSNLGAIETIKKRFNVLTGYSDHSEGIEAPVIAVILGAVVIEKHITLDKNLPGADHKFALDPSELKNMVKDIRKTEKLPYNEKNKKLKSIKNFNEIIGSYKIKPTNSELKMRKYTRKSIVAKHNLNKGDIISMDNIAFKRPSIGIPVNSYKKIIGKRIKSDIQKDGFISFENLE